MSTLLIEPHYLGSLEYFVLLRKSETIQLEVCAHYTKQTFKTRTVFLTANGTQSLTIPVKYGNRTPIKDVKIDHTGSWVRDHWGAFYSAYGKAPFFEFFADEFHAVWAKKQTFLIDLTIEMMSLCLKLTQIDRPLKLTDTFEKESQIAACDFREQIHPKKPFEERELYLPFQYTQVFGNNFVPNLSIIDLLMCVGNEADKVLRDSTSDASEHL